MTCINEKAYAKINISLDITGKRPDGYHDMLMVMQTITLCDDITVTLTPGRASRAESNLRFVPCDERNLAVRAANVFFAETGIGNMGAHIKMQKRIPVGAGMAGGSSDAAAVLRALNKLCGAGLDRVRLEQLAAHIGSDVAFCVCGGTQLASGRGELLSPLPSMPECGVVVCKPDFSVSTPELYQALDETFIEKRPDQKVMQLNLQKGDLLGIGGSLCNVFEPVVMQKHFDINYIRSMMYTYGAYGAQMTGSGSAVFGIYDSFEYATVACTMLKDKYSQIFLAKTV